MNENYKALRQEFKGSSDRAAVIVAASYLDELLLQMLKEYLIKDTDKKNKEIFSGNGPLSTFSSKINLSYRLGLISKRETDLINTIRAIRNYFAHQLSNASFENQSIKQKTENLSTPIELLIPEHIPIPQSTDESVPLPKIVKASKENPREIFQECVLFLVNVLAVRLNNLEKIDSLEEFQSAAEISEGMNSSYKRSSLKYLSLLDKKEELGETLNDKEKKQKENIELMLRTFDFCLNQISLAHEEKNYA